MFRTIFIILLFSTSFVNAQEARDSFEYIWGKRGTNPGEIGALNPDDFDFGSLRNYWATSAVIRSNIITNNIEGARYLFDAHLESHINELETIDFNTWVELASVEALLLRKERRLSESDKLYNEIIVKALGFDEEANPDNPYAGQLAYAHFHRAEIQRDLGQKKHVPFFYEESISWGKAGGNDNIVFDALANYSLFLINIDGNFEKAEELTREASTLNADTARATILLNMATARLLANKEHEFESALSLLRTTHEYAALHNKGELFSNLGEMIMGIEADKEDYETLQIAMEIEKSKRLRDALIIICFLIIALINSWLFFGRNKKRKTISLSAWKQFPR